MPLFLICVDGSASEDEAQACRRRLDGLQAQGWTYPPAVVDQADDVEATAPGDLPTLRTVGACITLPELGEDADETGVRRDVAALVSAFSELAQQARIEFVIEYGEEAVGWLDGGPEDARFLDQFFGDA